MYGREIEYLSSPLKVRLLWNTMAGGFFEINEINVKYEIND